MFQLDSRIQSTCFYLGDWPLSQVLLKNEQNYPWLVLVPRCENVQELYQLAQEEQLLLMQEINQLSLLITKHFRPQKLNTAMLGNIVNQLHIHCVGRSSNDPLWPHSIWQSAYAPTPYSEEELATMLPTISQLVKQANEYLTAHCMR